MSYITEQNQPPGWYPESTGEEGGGGITPTGTKYITIEENGTTTEDVTEYASAEITVDVQGGSIPTGMTHIGNGSFTFPTKTVLNTPINHGLGLTPKAVVVWTNVEPSVGDMFYCLLTRELANNTGQTKTERFLAVKGSGTSGIDLSNYSDSNANLFITSTTFNVGHGSRYYEAGATYYWFAFD